MSFLTASLIIDFNLYWTFVGSSSNVILEVDNDLLIISLVLLIIFGESWVTALFIFP